MATSCPARGQPFAAPNASAPRCFVLYDRHVEKNGGSSVRTIFKRLEEHGECTYWGYDLSRESWKRVIASLHDLSQRPSSETAPPRLCIESHCGAGTQGLAQPRRLGELQRAFGDACVVRRLLRVRDPVSHYASFFGWAHTFTDNGIARSTNLTFDEWAAATPNLQSSVLMNSHAATVAKNAPAARLGKDRAVLIGSDASDALQQRVLQTAAGLFDYLVPLERFDEALLLLADELGLRHIQARPPARHRLPSPPTDPPVLAHPQHHRVSPGGCAPSYPERVDLDSRRECLALEQRLCDRRSRGGRRAAAAARRARDLAAFHAAAEASEALLRRVAPLDFALHALAARRFDAMLAARPPHARRALRAAHRRWLDASQGVWRGGPPASAPCKFVRTAYRARLDYPRHLCTPGPQVVMEAVWTDTHYLGHANLVPNTPECLAQPFRASTPRCARWVS